MSVSVTEKSTQKVTKKIKNLGVNVDVALPQLYREVKSWWRKVVVVVMKCRKNRMGVVAFK